MADVDDERYEDEETSDFPQETDEVTADNHPSENEQPDDQKHKSEDVDAVADSDHSPPTTLHAPGQSPENTDRNSVPEDSAEKNGTSKVGADERFPMPAWSNLDRYIFGYILSTVPVTGTVAGKYTVPARGIGKMRNCGIRKVKCGIQNAERSAEWWVKRGMRKGQSAR